MSRIKLFSALFLVALLVVVILQNTEVVETRLLFATVAMPRAALLSLAVLLGFALGFLASFMMGRKKKPTA